MAKQLGSRTACCQVNWLQLASEIAVSIQHTGFRFQRNEGNKLIQPILSGDLAYSALYSDSKSSGGVIFLSKISFNKWAAFGLSKALFLQLDDNEINQV